jgi:TonB family protein
MTNSDLCLLSSRSESQFCKLSAVRILLMTNGPKRDWEGPSRRRVPRFELQAPVDVTVVRSGMPSTVPGLSTNLGERGIAAVISGELIPGESVEVEIKLSPTTEPLQLHAIVRYQDQKRCGLEFVTMTPEQRALIREWARDPRHEGTSAGAVAAKLDKKEAVRQGPPVPHPNSRKPRRGLRRFGAVVLLMIVVGVAIFVWRWNRGWYQIESGLRSAQGLTEEKAPVRVAADVMQKLLVHRVEPAYPPEARDENLQGIIAVDIVVGPDGSVRSVRALNGPDVLARAATGALRWWKFEPYRMKGEAVAVESTVAVEFKR